MFIVNDDNSIDVTRGDIGVVSVSALSDDDSDYIFVPGDVVRLKILKAKDCGTVLLQKDVVVEEETTVVSIFLSGEDTKIGELINKPAKYWYEVELNPDTMPETIIGYDKSGPTLFTLYPEGGDIK